MLSSQDVRYYSLHVSLKNKRVLYAPLYNLLLHSIFIYPKDRPVSPLTVGNHTVPSIFIIYGIGDGVGRCLTRLIDHHPWGR